MGQCANIQSMMFKTPEEKELWLRVFLAQPPTELSAYAADKADLAVYRKREGDDAVQAIKARMLERGEN